MVSQENQKFYIGTLTATGSEGIYEGSLSAQGDLKLERLVV